MTHHPTDSPAVDIPIDTAPEVPAGAALPEKIGKYPVLRKLGEGATSDVFLCRDEFQGRDVAIKRVRGMRLVGLARARRLGLTGTGAAASDLGRHAGVVPVVQKESERVTIHRVAGDDDEADGYSRTGTSSTALPHEVEAWLGQAIGVFEPRLETGRAPAPASAAPPTKRLMYVLSASAARLELRLYLGSARRSGEISRHHPHSPAIADMLRTRPSYVTPADEALLAALLPFVLNRTSPPVPLQGRTATATLRQLLQSGSCWWVDGADDHPATPPGAALAWIDEVLALQLRWSADADERWSTHWSAEASEPGIDVHALVLLPEPHAVVRDAEGRLAVRPADVSAADLSGPVIGWLAGMPAVAAQALPQLVQRLKSVGLAHQVMLPLPERHAPALEELGELTLLPVLRLLTCPNVPSEAWLEGHQRPPPAGQPLRQAAAQLVLRYRVAAPGAMRAGAPWVFHSIISPYLNIGLLTPREICARAEESRQLS